MFSPRIAVIALAVAGLPLAACASDETPEPEPIEEDVPFDPNVDDGVDTEVEKSENLNFDDDEA